MQDNTTPVSPVFPEETSTMPGSLPPVVTPEPPKKKSNIVMMILILIILVLLVAAGFVAYQYVMLKNETVVKPTPKVVILTSPSPVATPIVTPTASPSATPDPMAGWKTYTNSALSFSFKYPSDWKLTTNNNMDQITSSDFVQNPDEHVEIEAKSGVYISVPSSTSSNIPALTPKNGDVVGGGDVSDSRLVSNVMSINLGGQTATKWDFQGVHQKGILGTEIQFTKNKNAYGIMVFYSSNFNKEILTQILSTFKFQ